MNTEEFKWGWITEINTKIDMNSVAKLSVRNVKEFFEGKRFI